MSLSVMKARLRFSVITARLSFSVIKARLSFSVIKARLKGPGNFTQCKGVVVERRKGCREMVGGGGGAV